MPKKIVWVLGWRPLHTMGQKICFWIPGMGVLGMRNAKSFWGFLGWRSVHTHPVDFCIAHSKHTHPRTSGLPKISPTHPLD